MLHETIKRNIQLLLENKNWTITHLEMKTGGGRNVTNLFRNKSKNPTINVLNSIAKALDTTVQDLITEEQTLTTTHISVKEFKLHCHNAIRELANVSDNTKYPYSKLIKLISNKVFVVD